MVDDFRCAGFLARYQNKVNVHPTGRLRREDVPAPARVDHVESAQLRLTANLGVFWPTWLYEQEKNKKPDGRKVIRLKFGTNWQYGVVMDEMVHGCPVGAIRLENVHLNSVSLARNLLDEGDDEDRSFRKGQSPSLFHEAEQRVLGQVQLQRKAKEDVTDEYTLKPPAKGTKRERNDDDTNSSSDLDFFGHMMEPCLKIPPAKKQRQKEEEEPDDEAAREEAKSASGKKAEGKPRYAASASDGATPESKKTKSCELRGDSRQGRCGHQVRGARRSKNLSRQIREVNNASVILKDAEKLMAEAKTCKTFKALQVTTVDQCLRKIQGKLADGVVEVLCADSGSPLPEENEEDDDGKRKAPPVNWSEEGMTVVVKL